MAEVGISGVPGWKGDVWVDRCSATGAVVECAGGAGERGGEGSAIELTGERLADSRKGELGGTWEPSFGVEIVGRTTCR